ncbi:MAG: hypothetical protein IKK27_02685 [Alistipes sp.]|nr:hypothetical protein [Rikenellaceae bacterium]MBR3792831.1 hypothetical protein [Alistipes sp.]
MKKFLFVIFALLATYSVSAQTILDSDKKMLFVYISHDNLVNQDKLCDRLRGYYEEAVMYPGNVTVFYLANEDNPIVVEVNTNRDNRQDFEKFISAIQDYNFHAVYPLADVQHIIEIFNRLDFVGDDGKTLNYNTADWFFYVTSKFWEDGYHQDVVANLSFIMGADQYDPYNFQVKFYFPEYAFPKINEETPFGVKNLGGMNKLFYGFTY